MAEVASGPALTVCMVYSPAPRLMLELTLTLPQGATVRDAVHDSGLLARFEGILFGPDAVGVWGRRVGPDQVLREGDRIEIYRPLQVDPKVARRERFRRQGARSAGLFAKRGIPVAAT
jgi:putative ubiquitin-RnfH superfamily antitoxin RatB of RatAB toxin-antitoxin module